jgi:hypothetical protein
VWVTVRSVLKLNTTLRILASPITSKLAEHLTFGDTCGVIARIMKVRGERPTFYRTTNAARKKDALISGEDTNTLRDTILITTGIKSEST